MFSKF